MSKNSPDWGYFLYTVYHDPIGADACTSGDACGIVKKSLRVFGYAKERPTTRNDSGAFLFVYIAITKGNKISTWFTLTHHRRLWHYINAASDTADCIYILYY